MESPTAGTNAQSMMKRMNSRTKEQPTFDEGILLHESNTLGRSTWKLYLREYNGHAYFYLQKWNKGKPTKQHITFNGDLELVLDAVNAAVGVDMSIILPKQELTERVDSKEEDAIEF